MHAQYNVFRLEDHNQAETLIVKKTVAILTDAIKARGRASLMLSGGSTPRQVYLDLSNSDIAWEKVTIGLVDERWVDTDSPGSNERFLRETIGQNRGASASILGMKTAHDKAGEGVNALEDVYSQIDRPFDLCFMGMGGDGHTASWFPGSKGLDAALDINNSNLVSAVDAAGCPGAGEYPSRMTLTLPAVMQSRHIFLFITGEHKSDVFQSAANSSVDLIPVKALLAAGPRLSVFWAP